MKKKIICIECPNSCEMEVEIEDNKVLRVMNHRCEKGETYARCEIESPVRIFTTVVRAQGLSVKMLPVKTEKAIPKAFMSKAMAEIKKIRVTQPVSVGGVIVEDFLKSGVNLVAARSVGRKEE